MFVAERRLSVARPFKAGIRMSIPSFVAERRLKVGFQASLTRRAALVELSPGLERPGYTQLSLRDDLARH